MSMRLTPCSSSHAKLIAFLQRLQEAALLTFGEEKFDPKRYMDLPLKYDVAVVEEAFDQLPWKNDGSVTIEQLQRFIEQYFNDEGDDMVYYEPPDFLNEPVGFLPTVMNHKVRSWALQVHALWKTLGRRVSEQVFQHPFLHTLLPLPEAVIIPGSRFREVYYWDSYWIIRGLLASKMHETAKGIVVNLIHLLNIYGHVPNGARTYYTNRSQPPLLSSMIREIHDKTGDYKLVETALPALLTEHQFWNSDEHKVLVQDCNGNLHTLNRYYAFWNKPRPESATIDKRSASRFCTSDEKQQFYRELASDAESGMDFSSRWMRVHSEFTTLATTSVLPVDLNVFMLKMEMDIAYFANIVGEIDTANHFMKLSKTRKRAIETLFWSNKFGQWLDYWLKDGSSKSKEIWNEELQNQCIFASNFVPLWLDVFYSDTVLVEKVKTSLHDSGLILPAGIATSLVDSKEQWDYPNGWAPLQHMIIEGLARSRSRKAQALAEELAIRWIRTNYMTYQKTGAMHEKYDVRKCGEFGAGGEYEPQIGFGWSNGVALALLEEFGWPEDRDVDCAF